MPSIEEQLTLHEGLRTKVYKCPAGKWTVGVGRNLEDRGITNDEALYLLRNDIKSISNALTLKYTWFAYLDKVRQKVCIDMAFNLGIGGFSRFQNMIRALAVKDYQKAAKEMEDSAWYHQVGARGKRLAEMMRTGQDYKE